MAQTKPNQTSPTLVLAYLGHLHSGNILEDPPQLPVLCQCQYPWVRDSEKSEWVDVGPIVLDTSEVRLQDLQPLESGYGRTQKDGSYDTGELFYFEICGDIVGNTESHQKNDYLIIQNYEEVSSLYSNTVDEQQKHELMVQAVMSKLQQAMLDVQNAQAQLTEADYRVGRA
ncbi:hypothetical protein EDB85DRAFT_1892484 [Lactarius pseudohatsudake]|nr:hypothetical protein EDB85DRAFT_1892484 [Lactarius pseudohatsudake]